MWAVALAHADDVDVGANQLADEHPAGQLIC
jgi:hypothetical protein